MGMVLSPTAWRYPWCERYALDNDAFKAFSHNWGADWWQEKGEYAWLKMLAKVPVDHPPLFVTVPDVVGDWEATKNRAAVYVPLLKQRGFASAIPLQNGCERDWSDALQFDTDAVFVGGDKRWKWFHLEEIVSYFHTAGKWVHVGRVNGHRLVHRCNQLGVDSLDGTGFSKFSDAMLPPMFDVVYNRQSQLSMNL
jgi:hypothetical protein